MDLSRLIELVWIGGLAATPIVIGVSLTCRSARLRPATKHALWAAALASFLTPLAVAAVWRNTWFASDRVLSLADRVLPAEHAANTDTMPGLASNTPSTSSHPDTTRDNVARELLPTPRAFFGSPAGTSPLLASNSSLPSSSKLADGSLRTTLSRNHTTHLKSSSAKSSSAKSEPRTSTTRADAPLADLVSPVHDVSPVLDRATPPGPGAQPSLDAWPAAALPAPTANDPAHVAATEPAPLSKLVSGLSNAAHATLVRLVAVRDAIGGLPPVPIYVWLGVAAFLIVLRAFRSVALRRIISRARPAPRRVRLLVADMADVMGLESPPETLATDARISPMVWCGVRPKLVIPEDLWASLDDDSRRAVIAHELAHLKRRDHVLHWVAAFVGACYWWHPAAWWARRKLNEEAEASCDAWVTSLFPRRRRAYAEALLVTSSFLGSPAYHAGPALGVVNGRSKLARRITMVMTQRTAPKVSKVGVVVAALVLATGALVTPGLACPPEKEAKAATTRRAPSAPRESSGGEAGAFLGEAPAIDAMIQAEKAQKAKAQKSKAQKAKTRNGPTAYVAPDTATSTGTSVMVYGQDAAALKAAAKAYAEQATALQAELQAKAAASDAFAADAAALATQDAARQAERAAKIYAEAARRGWRVRTLDPLGGVSTPVAPSAPMAPTAPVPPSADVWGGTATTTPAPSAMNPLGGGVATMSGPAEGTEPREYRLPAGKLNALTELMSRQDVPIWIERGNGKIVVHATPEQHEVFGAFVRLINPVNGAGVSAAPSPRAVNRQQNMDSLRARLEQLTAQRDQHEQQADKLRERAELIREQAERFREMAEELRDKARESDDDVSRNALQNAEQSMNQQGNNFETQAADLQARLDSFESQAQELEAAIDDMQSRIDALNDTDDEDSDAESAVAAVDPTELDVVGMEMPEIEMPAIELPALEVPDADFEVEGLDLQIPAGDLEVPAAPAAPAAPSAPSAPSAPASPTAPAAPSSQPTVL